MLIIALMTKNSTLTKTSYIIILIAGIAALPVFFTGEGTEKAVENAPGVSEGIIERHEEVANLAMISVAAAGVLALGALFSVKWIRAARVFRVVVLFLAVLSGGLMARTAHLGGQIRHTEIRNGASMQSRNDAAEKNETSSNNQQQQQDDD